METKRSESIMNLAAALAVAQGQIKTAPKDNTAKVSTKSGGEFTYKYSTLDDIWNACRKPLSDNGLSVVQIPINDKEGFYLESILLHSSGEWMSGTLTLPIVADRMSQLQAMGSAITYARRYALAAMVGVTTGDDDDGAAARKSTERKVSSPKNGNQKLAPPPWLPTKNEFFDKALKDFPGLTEQDIKDELQAAGFTGFLSKDGLKMMEALKKRKSAMDEVEADQTPF